MLAPPLLMHGYTELRLARLPAQIARKCHVRLLLSTAFLSAARSPVVHNDPMGSVKHIAAHLALKLALRFLGHRRASWYCSGSTATTYCTGCRIG